MRTRLACLLVIVAAWIATPLAFHFELVRSLPTSNATLKISPATIQLWFSQVPAAGVSQVTLSDQRGNVATSKTAIDDSAKSMTIAPAAPLAPGSYTIHWRGAGDDGHVVSGTLRFTVAGK